MPTTFGKEDELNRPDLGNYRLSLPYAFYLRRAPGAAAGSSDYESDTAVLDQISDYAVNEPFTVVITPTQDDGKYITNNGVIMRDIIISGTTGFMPNAVNTSVRPLSNGAEQVIGINQVSTSAEDNRRKNSGFIRFVKLRNLFRRYSQIKKKGTPSDANATFLFFYDRKLDEWWVVEPLNFKMQKTKAKPFTYDYTIHLQTIAPGNDTPLPMVLDLPKDVEISGAGASFSPAITEVNNIVGRLRGISAAIVAFAGKANRAVQDALNQVLGPLDAVTGVFAAAAAGIETIQSIPSGLQARMMNSLDGLVNQTARLQTDIETATSVNDLYIETRQLVESLFARVADIFGNARDPNNPIAVLADENKKYTQQRSLGGPVGLSINDPNGSTTLPTAPFLNGSGLNLLSGVDFGSYDTVKKQTVFDRESIFDLARRATGSVHMVPLIIALNRLQFPYFINRSEPYRVGTKRWGDEILIPAISNLTTPAGGTKLPSTPPVSWIGGVTSVPTTTSVTDANSTWREHQWVGYTFTITEGTGIGQTAIVKSNTAQTLTLDRVLSPQPDATSRYTLTLVQQTKRRVVSAIEALYGFDALLVIDEHPATPPVQVADLFLGGFGDIVLLGGFPNLIQAMRILFYTEQGTNVANPLFGIPNPVGERASVDRLIAYNFNVRAGLLADPRIEQVTKTAFQVNGDVTDLQATVIPIGGQAEVIALPTSL